MGFIGSARNGELEREVESMPDWLRPNGDFGVGMQSVFGIVQSFSGVSTTRPEGKTRKLYFHTISNP